MSWTHLRQLDERAIRYFTVVCEEHSVRAAAERLRIAPSAISRKLKELETDLDIQLLSRTNKGFVPTTLGTVLLDYLVQRHTEDAAIVTKLLELSRLRRGEIRIGLGEAFLADFVTSALSRCVLRQPELRFDLLVRNTEQIVHSIEHDDIEIGIAFNPPPTQNATVAFERRSPIVCAFPAAWSQFGEAPVTLAQLDGLPCALLSREFSLRRLIDDAERAAGTRLRVLVETNSLYALKQFVGAGLGMALLPDFAMRPEIRGGGVRQTPVLAPGFDQACVRALVSRSGKDHAPTRELLAIMLEAMEIAHLDPGDSIAPAGVRFTP